MAVDRFVVLDGEAIDLNTVRGSWVWAFYKRVSHAENVGRPFPTGKGFIHGSVCYSTVLGAYDRDNATDMFHDDPSNRVRRTVHVGPRRGDATRTSSHCAPCEWCGGLCEWDVCRQTSKLIAFDRSTGAVHRCDPEAIQWMRNEWAGAAKSALATYLAAKKLVSTFTPTTPDTIALNVVMRMHTARNMYLELRDQVARFARRCASDPV